MADCMEDSLDLPLARVLPVIQDSIVNQTSYFGVRAQKNPLDAWVYQEILYEMRPDVVIEIGNANGGGALYLAHLCDLLGKGRVIGIDLSHRQVPDEVKAHPRITFIDGDACERFDEVSRMIGGDETVLVIEDSSHTYANTLNVLRLYSQLTRPGDYFIVEDSICRHGLPVGPDPGPYEAIDDFVQENPEFEIDRTRERFLITWNPKGYLRRRQRDAGLPGSNRPQHSATRRNVKGAAVRETVALFIPPIFIRLWNRMTLRK